MTRNVGAKVSALIMIRALGETGALGSIEMVIVQEQRLSPIKHAEKRLRLYAHQAVMLDEWETHKTFIMVTKTGTGKAIGAVIHQVEAGLEIAGF